MSAFLRHCVKPGEQAVRMEHTVSGKTSETAGISVFYMDPYKVLFLEGQQQIAGIDAIACSNVNLVDNTVLFGNDSCL